MRPTFLDDKIEVRHLLQVVSCWLRCRSAYADNVLDLDS